MSSPVPEDSIRKQYRLTKRDEDTQLLLDYKIQDEDGDLLAAGRHLLAQIQYDAAIDGITDPPTGAVLKAEILKRVRAVDKKKNPEKYKKDKSSKSE